MARFTPTNLHKPFWPEPGYTKGDLLAYLEAVAPVLLPVLRDRPLTLKRSPDGVEGFTFYQKNTPNYAPSWIRTVRIRAESARRDVDYVLCNSRSTLLWLGNQATIEFHPFLSRADRPDRPDHLVFDLDPPEGRFELAVETVRLLKEVLDDLGLAAALKTSGSKGLHVFVPLVRRYDFDRVRAAAERIAGRMLEREPGLVTGEIRKAGRGGRVLIDTGRNAPGATVVCAYSPRARPRATVSFPVAWDALGRADPLAYTIRTVPPLVDGRDPWGELMPARQTLPRELR